MHRDVYAGQSVSLFCRSHLPRSKGKAATDERETWQHGAYSTVDNFAGNVDGEAAGNSFHAQTGDGISADSTGRGR
jgi:hypothetical protein